MGAPKKSCLFRGPLRGPLWGPKKKSSLFRGPLRGPLGGPKKKVVSLGGPFGGPFRGEKNSLGADGGTVNYLRVPEGSGHYKVVYTDPSLRWETLKPM